MKPKIAIIEDEEFYRQLWKIHLSNEAELFIFEDPDIFLETQLTNLNIFSYIIVDIMYGSNNILNINFSKIIRKHNYLKPLILYSNYKQNLIELERLHYYDLFLSKDKTFSLNEIDSRLQHEKLNWRNRLKYLELPLGVSHC